MTLLTTSHNRIIVCANDKIISFNVEDKTTNEIQLPPLILPPNLTKNQQDVLKNERTTVLATNFSKCGKYFAVCTLNKQLVLLDSGNKVVKNWNVARSVSKIRFTPSGDIIVADKTGDVYLYELKNENCEPKHVLGHLSMLLDVLISDCGKYIVSCDRDEKIRVSRFPESYNIVSYCLGHEEFVLNIEFYNLNILVSASGDGSIRFWDYLSGKQKLIINTNDYVKDKNLVQKFSDYMDSETVDVHSLPITKMKLMKLINSTLIVVSLFEYNALQVYEAVGEIEVKLLQIINFGDKLLSFDLTNKLYVLTENGIQAYEFHNNSFNVCPFPELDHFYGNCKGLIKNTAAENISVLYKRKYDNVQVYQERKKLRIENQR